VLFLISHHLLINLFKDGFPFLFNVLDGAWQKKFLHFKQKLVYLGEPDNQQKGDP